MLRGLTYRYDDVGSIVGLVDVGPAGVQHQTFAYDGLHRLTAATVRAGSAGGAVVAQHAYSYDDTGNLQHYGDLAPADLTYGDAARPGRVTSVFRGGSAAPVEYGTGAR